MKHAGGVRKGFSILAGILLTGYIDVMVAGNPLTVRKMVALPIVLGASYLHIVSPVRMVTVAHVRDVRLLMSAMCTLVSLSRRHPLTPDSTSNRNEQTAKTKSPIKTRITRA